jgi:hypothetical protein
MVPAHWAEAAKVRAARPVIELSTVVAPTGDAEHDRRFP